MKGARPTRWAGAVACAAVALLLAPAAAASEPTPEGRIAFRSDRPSGFSTALYTMRADGSDLRQVTFGTTDKEPAWSPDGSRIAYARFADGTSFDIVVMDADGSNPLVLVASPEQDTQPAWSPDGSLIAYRGLTQDAQGFFHSRIFVVPADGSGPPVAITEPSLEAEDPAWSPDGRRIAFTAFTGDSPDVVVANADGSSLRRLTYHVETDRRPAWSPDGTKIAFESFRDDGDADVYVMDPDGSNITRLTTGPAADGDPAWSPDGRRLAFASDRDGAGNFRLWSMAADGSGLRRITSGLFNDLDPAWQHFGAPATLPDGPFQVERGTSLLLLEPGLLRNDFDGAGDPLSAVLARPPTAGTVAVLPNGSFDYAHGGGSGLGDGFSYVADDGTYRSPPAEVTLLITQPGGRGDLVGVVDERSARWHLARPNGTVLSFTFGNPGDNPFVGDWDCDGVDTPGLHRPSDGLVYLRNSNSTGRADIQFFFGNPGDIPLVGDFDGDGCDTVSLYRPAEGRVFVIDELGSGRDGLGAATFSYLFGDPGDTPFAGDFDGDGVDTVGLYRESAGLVFLRNRHTSGAADRTFFYGNPDDRFVAGDWGGDGVDTVGVFRRSSTRFHLRDRNTAGPADVSFPFDGGRGVPVAGDFGLP